MSLTPRRELPHGLLKQFTEQNTLERRTVFWSPVSLYTIFKKNFFGRAKWHAGMELVPLQ